jgi:WD40 repeat protein
MKDPVVPLLALVLACSLVQACQDDDDGPLQPLTQGTLQVSVTVTGSQPDPDGFTISLDGPSRQSVPASGGTVRFEGVAAGSHSVALEGLASNCSVTGANPRSIEVRGGEVAQLEFSVACLSQFGSVVVRSVTTGTDLDPDGYTVDLVPHVSPGAIGANDSLVFENVPLGAYGIELRDVALNCLVVPVPLASVLVRAEAVTLVDLRLGCFPRDSKIVYETIDGIFLFDFRAQTEVNLTPNGWLNILPALSPDGSRIVFSSDRFSPGDLELYVMNADGTGVIRLTNSSGVDIVSSGAWSPDGSRIVFTSVRDDPHGDIYVMNADGTGVVRLTNDPAFDALPAWAPDGSRIAFLRTFDPEGISDIYLMNAADGSGIVKLTNPGLDPGFGINNGAPAWSPDGSRIAHGSASMVNIISRDGAALGSANMYGDPTWSPDGTAIAWVSNFRLAFALVEPSGALRPAISSGFQISPPQGSRLSWR